MTNIIKRCIINTFKFFDRVATIRNLYVLIAVANVVIFCIDPSGAFIGLSCAIAVLIGGAVLMLFTAGVIELLEKIRKWAES